MTVYRVNFVVSIAVAIVAIAGENLQVFSHETLQAAASQPSVSSVSRLSKKHALIRGQKLLFVVRHQYEPDHHGTATLFQNGEINAHKFQGGSAIKVMDFSQGEKVRTLIDSPQGVVRDPEISYDGKRILFSMRRNPADDYHIYEMHVDGSHLRQLTFGKKLSDIDPAYLPDGTIVFSSTRDYKFCQCNRHIMANLFRMDADGSNIIQIGGNTLFEGHPHVMPDGQILYDRWEYVDRQFGASFGLWTVNPDGARHALYFGNNAWSPGMITDAHMIPGTHRFVATYGSCHDRPWGALAIVDPVLGKDGLSPVVHSWPANIGKYLNDTDVNDPSHRQAGRIDAFKQITIKYEDPYPLSEHYFLCSRMIRKEGPMGIYLLDLHGQELLLHSETPGCFDPMLIAPRPRPAVLSSRADSSRDTGTYYVADVYAGTKMQTVPRGEIRSLRIVEAPPKTQWTHTFWNVDGTQAPAMNWNATNNKRILGTIPVEEDGSAYFEVPADKFVFFQALDKKGMMVQSMRSGAVVRRGETVGCVGCHDHHQNTVRSDIRPLAMLRPASKLTSWHGPTRNFNYLTEVQPVFTRRCVSCHDYDKPAGKVLNLSGDLGLAFNTSYVDLRRKSPIRWHAERPGEKKPLVKAVDDGPPQVLKPYAWGSQRSRLVDVLASGHHGVELSADEFDRIVTWIDLNAPYYGTYASAYPNNPFGRSPLSSEELEQLSRWTGVPLARKGTGFELHGSQVNFTRPHLSPCLTKLKTRNLALYRKSLALIKLGKQRLADRPRADMPGFRSASVHRKDPQEVGHFERSSQLMNAAEAMQLQETSAIKLRPLKERQ